MHNTKTIIESVDKALSAKLDDNTVSKIVDRVVSQAAGGDKESIGHLVALLRASRGFTMSW